MKLSNLLTIDGVYLVRDSDTEDIGTVIVINNTGYPLPADVYYADTESMDLTHLPTKGWPFTPAELKCDVVLLAARPGAVIH